VYKAKRVCLKVAKPRIACGTSPHDQYGQCAQRVHSPVSVDHALHGHHVHQARGPSGGHVDDRQYEPNESHAYSKEHEHADYVSSLNDCDAHSYFASHPHVNKLKGSIPPLEKLQAY
jgi:hypothetical protein